MHNSKDYADQGIGTRAAAAAPSPGEPAPQSGESAAAQATGDYFLLEPDAEGFVRGETEKLPAGEAGCGVFFLIPFVLAGLMMLGFAVHLWVRTLALSAFSGEALGTYVSKEIDNSGDSTRYLVSYRFVVDDRVYVVRESVDSATYDHADDGDRLRVRYAVRDPDTASIEPANFVGPVGLTCFGLVWSGIVFGLYVSQLSTVIRRKRLSRDGKLITGEIVRTSSDKDSDGNLILEAEVRVCSPQTGEWLRKTYSPMRNDLKGKPLPGSGTPAYVLYIDDKAFEAL
jgi:hypothetical protein